MLWQWFGAHSRHEGKHNVAKTCARACILALVLKKQCVRNVWRAPLPLGRAGQRRTDSDADKGDKVCTNG